MRELMRFNESDSLRGESGRELKVEVPALPIKKGESASKNRVAGGKRRAVQSRLDLSGVKEFFSGVGRPGRLENVFAESTVRLSCKFSKGFPIRHFLLVFSLGCVEPVGLSLFGECEASANRF